MLKCDEAPNSCGACLKRGTCCSFKQPIPPPSLQPIPSPQPQVSKPIPVSSLLDLELLHNFSNKTCTTITQNAALYDFYRTDFITEALKCTYVLHCLLGLSALHLVHQQHELLQTAPSHELPAIRTKLEDYLLAASFHYNAGLSTFRQDITHINEQNCHNLFAASTLIVMTSFADSCDSVRLSSVANEGPDPTVTKWHILLRGIKAVVEGTWQWVKSGPMAPILAPRRLEGYDTEVAAEDEDAKRYLETLSDSFKEHSDPEVSRICITAIELLRKSWAGIASGCDFGVAFFWAVLVDDEFMALLEMKRSEALLVLGAFCVLMYGENWQWWMRGWPKTMLRMIEGMVEERWRGWLEWPASVIADEEAGQWKEKVLVVTEGICCQ